MFFFINHKKNYTISKEKNNKSFYFIYDNL